MKDYRYIQWFSSSYLRLVHLHPFPVCRLSTEIQIWVRLAQKILKQQTAAEHFLHLMYMVAAVQCMFLLFNDWYIA